MTRRYSRGGGNASERRQRNRKAEEDDGVDDATQTRIIIDNHYSIEKARDSSLQELLDDLRPTVLELHEAGTPVAIIQKETGLSFGIVSKIIAKVESANEPENLIKTLVGQSQYQQRPQGKSYSKLPFDHYKIWQNLRDKIDWTKTEVRDYIANHADNFIQERSRKIRYELMNKRKISARDLEKIAIKLDTHVEIVKLEYTQLGGEGRDERITTLANKHGVGLNYMFALDKCATDPKNSDHRGNPNFLRIAMTLEQRLGKGKVSLDKVAKIVRAEYI